MKQSILRYLRSHPDATFPELVQACGDCRLDLYKLVGCGIILVTAHVQDNGISFYNTYKLREKE